MEQPHVVLYSTIEFPLHSLAAPHYLCLPSPSIHPSISGGGVCIGILPPLRGTPALYLALPRERGKGRIISGVLGVKEGMTFAESSVTYHPGIRKCGWLLYPQIRKSLILSCGVYTEHPENVCMWLREISSCSCLTVLPGPAWVLLSKIYTLFPGALYIVYLRRQDASSRLVLLSFLRIKVWCKKGSDLRTRSNVRHASDAFGIPGNTEHPENVCTWLLVRGNFLPALA